MKRFVTVVNVVRLAAIAMLVPPVFRVMPHDYYSVLKWFVCLAFIFAASLANKRGQTYWASVLGLAAVFYNPLLPFPFRRGTWVVINAASIVLMALSLRFSDRLSTENKDPQLLIPMLMIIMLLLGFFAHLGHSVSTGEYPEGPF